MKNLEKKIEILANVAIVVVAILLGIVLVKSYLLAAPGQKLAADSSVTGKVIRNGEAVNLPDINWRKNGRTLLLAVSTTCRYCTESAPFYQRLVKERGDTRLIALVPQAVNEGQQYLKNLGVEVDEIRQVSMSAVGVNGTPTLILVDGNGKVANLWVGALPAEQEKEVLSQLQTDRASK